MNIMHMVVGVVAGAALAMLACRKSESPAVRGNDATFFKTTPGSKGFCNGMVLRNRVRASPGGLIHWNRLGACRPAEGGFFLIRTKGPSPLDPEEPKGVDSIVASVKLDAVPHTAHPYSLIMVKADGTERVLHDPDIMIEP